MKALQLSKMSHDLLLRYLGLAATRGYGTCYGVGTLTMSGRIHYPIYRIR
jgi:hypothetical protein